jgi:hypothetical protein
MIISLCSVSKEFRRRSSQIGVEKASSDDYATQNTIFSPPKNSKSAACAESIIDRIEILDVGIIFRYSSKQVSMVSSPSKGTKVGFHE